MNRIALLAATCALVFGSSSALAATTYLASRAVGTGFVDLSITTDDTIGVIGNNNILDWDITVKQGSDRFNIEGPGGSRNSEYTIFGFGLTATATDLYFNFDDMMSYVLFQTPFTGSALPFWCLQSTRCYEVSDLPGEGILATADFNSHVSQAYTGNRIVASVGGGAVPEPATWALMITGFGLAGSALRSGRRAKAA